MVRLLGWFMEEIVKKIEERKQEHFDKLHSKDLINITKNYTEDEQADVIKVMPSNLMLEELERRNKVVTSILDDVNEAMKQYSEMTSLVEKEALLSQIKKIARIVEDE